MNQQGFHFDGATYEPEHDQVRLTGQLLRVYNVMYGNFDVGHSAESHYPKSADVATCLPHFKVS